MSVSETNTPGNGSSPTRGAEVGVAAGCLLVALVALVPQLTARPAPAPDDPIVAAKDAGPGHGLTYVASALMVDDAWYYLQIARHIAEGEGPSFDGRHPTNGYQPLWLFCLVPLAWTFAAPRSLLLAAFALQALLAAGISAALYCTARAIAPPMLSALSVLVWLRLQHTYWSTWSGMEYALNALLLVGVVALLLSSCEDRKRSTRWLVLFGGVAALAFLARIDNALLCLALGAWLWLEAPSGRRLRTLAFFSAPVLVVVVGYVTLNLGLFGTPLPISGTVKLAWSAQALARDPSYLAHGWLWAKALDAAHAFSHYSRSATLGLLLGSLGALGTAAFARTPVVRRLAPVAAFALAQPLLYLALFHQGRALKPWYYAVQPLLASLIAVWWLQGFVGWARRRLAARGRESRWLDWVVALAVALVLAVSLGINAARHRKHLQGYGSEPLYVAAGWARAHLPADAVVGSWNAGTIAFFSQRTVINLDGLVNSREYFRSERHDLCAYAEREGIGYLVDAFPPEEPLRLYARELSGCLDAWRPIWRGPPSTRAPEAWRAMAFERVGR